MIEIVEQGAEKVGGLGKLADGLGIKHQAFYSWKKVPAERVLEFERLTGISRHEQRPDVFGPEPDAADEGVTAAPAAGDTDEFDTAAPACVAAGSDPVPQVGAGHSHSCVVSE